MITIHISQPSIVKFLSCAAAILGLGIASAVASPEITLPLSPQEFGPGKEIRAVSKGVISQSTTYTYSVKGTCVGTGGLKNIIKKGTPISSLFNGVKFSGTYTTPGGALPITVFNKKFKGTREIKGVGDVTLSAKLEGGILKSGKLYFNVTNVKIKAAAPLPAGTIRFEKGAMLIVTAAPVVEFKSTSSSISESGEVINVEVTKSGKGKASVSFATASGTADSTNFTPTTGTLNFGSGTKTSTQVIQVPILPDSIPSGSRQFTITLSSPGGRAVLGAKVTHTVTINADEL